VDAAITALGGMGQNILTPNFPHAAKYHITSILFYGENVNLEPRGGKPRDAVIITRPIEENK
jgi:hypothetical protein